MTPSIGSLIREARKEKGLTQEQLASLVHVSRQTVSHWENGRAEPGYDMLRTLSEVLGLDLSPFFSDSACAQSAAIQAASDTQPAEEAPPSISLKPPRRRTALAAVCILLAVFLIAIAAGRARSAIALNRFMQEQTDDSAGVLLYTRESSIPRTGSGDSAKWEFPIFLKEQRGIGMEFSSLRLFWFRKSGAPLTDELTAAAFINHTGSTRIGPGEIRFINIGKLAADDFTHFGCILSGVDDSGRELSSRLLIPLD